MVDLTNFSTETQTTPTSGEASEQSDNVVDWQSFGKRGTFALGVGGNLGAGGASSASLLWTRDRNGGAGFQTSGGLGGLLGKSGNLGLVFQMTSAYSIYQLSGPSQVAGGSFTIPLTLAGIGVNVGFEVIKTDPFSYGGLNLSIGVGFGTIHEAHAYSERTWMFGDCAGLRYILGLP